MKDPEEKTALGRAVVRSIDSRATPLRHADRLRIQPLCLSTLPSLSLPKRPIWAHFFSQRQVFSYLASLP